jgi:hypothetical protein
VVENSEDVQQGTWAQSTEFINQCSEREFLGTVLSILDMIF